MIRVDCRDVDPIMHELLVHVSDDVGAIPAIKLHEFMLSPVGEERLDTGAVVSSIRNFLDTMGEARNFAVVASGSDVMIKSLTGRPISEEKAARPAGEMFSCPHCGFVTRYEAELNAHRRIHYF